MKINIDENKIFTMEEGIILKQYDFNLYPLYIIEPHYQLFLVPTNGNGQDCYIVRKDDSANGVRHNEFAKQLVNSQYFYDSELEDYINSDGKTSRWCLEKSNYYEGEELEYLIEKKGFILFSPQPKDSNRKSIICKEFIPSNSTLMTKQQVNNLLFLIERDSRITIENQLLTRLYNLVITEKKEK